jgi:hypothetical protein
MAEKKDKKTLEKKVELDLVDFERAIIDTLREIEDRRKEILTLVEDARYYLNKGYNVKYFYDPKSKSLSYTANPKEKRKIGFRYGQDTR